MADKEKQETEGELKKEPHKSQKVKASAADRRDYWDELHGKCD